MTIFPRSTSDDNESEEAWGFDTTSTPEPHALRRKEILRHHPEIAELFGHDRRTVIPMLLAVFGQLAIAALVAQCAILGHLWVWLPLTFVVVHIAGAVLSHHSSMFIHEASHNLIAPTARENKFWALLANTTLLIPAAMTFRKYHPRHHAHLGTLGVDADLPCRLEATRFPRNAAMKGFWLGAGVFFWMIRGYSRRTPPSRDEVINVAVTLVVNVALFMWLGPIGFLYLLASTVVGHSYHPVAAHFIHEHFVFAEGQETNSYYGALNAVCFNVGYHVEHHDFPGCRAGGCRS